MSNARNLSKFKPSSSGLVETEDIADDAVTTAKVNPSQTDITSVGALNAGSITSGFGAIDVGSSDITTTGSGSFGNINNTTVANISFNSHGTYLGNYRSIGWGGTANGTTQIYSQYNTIDHLVLHAGTGKDIIFETGGSTADRMTLDSNGDLTIGSGNLIIGTSGKGIDFSATSDGSGANQAEVLDDYEEGTWTPTLSNGGSVTINAAVYTKIGNLIRVGTYLALSSIPNDSNTFYIASLPYNVSYTAGGGNDHYHGAGSITYVGSHNIAGFGMLPPTPYTGQASMYFHRGDGSSSVVRNSDVTGMPYIIVATSYMTA